MSESSKSQAKKNSSGAPNSRLRKLTAATRVRRRTTNAGVDVVIAIAIADIINGDATEAIGIGVATVAPPQGHGHGHVRAPAVDDALLRVASQTIQKHADCNGEKFAWSAWQGAQLQRRATTRSAQRTGWKAVRTLECHTSTTGNWLLALICSVFLTGEVVRARGVA